MSEEIEVTTALGQLHVGFYARWSPRTHNTLCLVEAIFCGTRPHLAFARMRWIDEDPSAPTENFVTADSLVPEDVVTMLGRLEDES